MYVSKIFNSTVFHFLINILPKWYDVLNDNSVLCILRFHLCIYVTFHVLIPRQIGAESTRSLTNIITDIAQCCFSQNARRNNINFVTQTVQCTNI